MLRIGFRLACVLSWLALDAMVAWWLVSAAGSFVQMEWSAASATALGRAAWLVAFLYLARHSTNEAIAHADRYLAKAPAS